MNCTSFRPRITLFILLTFSACSIVFGAKKSPVVAFKRGPNGLLITIGATPFATHDFRDKEICRPYFAHVRAPDGVQVTPNLPPQHGDAHDHAAPHPEICLTFADINHNDYWPLKARNLHYGFLAPPQDSPRHGTFTVRNRYISAEERKTVCVETCRCTILVRPAGLLLIWDSTFTSTSGDSYFGDQEEFGLAMRVATPISVVKSGHITDSQGAGTRSRFGVNRPTGATTAA